MDYIHRCWQTYRGNSITSFDRSQRLLYKGAIASVGFVRDRGWDYVEEMRQGRNHRQTQYVEVRLGIVETALSEARLTSRLQPLENNLYLFRPRPYSYRPNPHSGHREPSATHRHVLFFREGVLESLRALEEPATVQRGAFCH